MVTSITNLYRLSVHAEAEASLPKVHMLRKEPLSVSLSHYMGVRDQGLFNWPTDYSAYALSLSPRSPADSQKPSCSLACRFREIRAPQQGLPLCASLGWEMEMSLSICL